jgi:hypothetical protein
MRQRLARDLAHPAAGLGSRQPTLSGFNRAECAREAHRGWREIRCQFGRLEPLNPFASCRDQRTSGPKSRNGIKRGKPHHPPEDLVPGTKTVVIGACAPIHPRVGPAVRPDSVADRYFCLGIRRSEREGLRRGLRGATLNIVLAALRGRHVTSNTIADLDSLGSASHRRAD